MAKGRNVKKKRGGENVVEKKCVCDSENKSGMKGNKRA